jgi:hypothetical protein
MSNNRKEQQKRKNHHHEMKILATEPMVLLQSVYTPSFSVSWQLAAGRCLINMYTNEMALGLIRQWIHSSQGPHSQESTTKHVVL